MASKTRADLRVRRVALYLRISKHDDASTSIEKQRANARRLVGERWPDADVTEFVDHASATKERRRPAFTALRERLGEYDVVVFDRQDRIARRPLDFWTFAAEAERHGTRVVGASEDLDLTTADGELTAGVRLSVARAEARRTADRVKATNAYRRSLGLRAIGGKPAFGLRRREDDRGRFEPDPVNGPIVVDAVDRIIAGAASIRSLTEEWTTRGIQTPRGGARWDVTTVGRILRHPALAGMTPHDGDVLRGADGEPLIDERQALISVDRYWQLQNALNARRATRRPLEAAPPPLLFGLAVCTSGHPLYRHRRPGRTDLYSCRIALCPGNVSVSRLALDEYVTTTVLDLFGAYEEVRPVTIPGRDTARVVSLRAQIEKVAAEIASAPVERIGDLAARLQALRKAEEEALSQDLGDRIDLVETGRTIREAFEAATSDEDRRLVLSGPLERVVVFKGAPGGRIPLPDRTALHWRGVPEEHLWDRLPIAEGAPGDGT